MNCFACAGLGHRMSWHSVVSPHGKEQVWMPGPCDECDGTGERPVGQTWASVWQKVKLS